MLFNYDHALINICYKCFKVSDVCGEIFFSLGYLRLAQRLAVVVIKVINLAKINDESPGR